MLAPVEISEFLGLNRKARWTKMDRRYAQAILNVDLSQDTLRPRPSIAKTSFLDSAGSHVTDPVRVLVLLHTLDGRKEMIWVQGDDVFMGTSPEILGAATASGTQLDSALSSATYPQKFRGPATVYFGIEVNGSVYLCNGQDAPLRYSPETGLQRWSIYQPRTMGWGVPIDPGNLIDQDGTNAAEPFAYGNLIYAFTYYNAATKEESNPSPLFEYGSDGNDLFPVNGKIGKFTWSLARPDDPQVTHLRLYRTLTGGTTNDLRRMAEVEVPAAGKVLFTADLSIAGHLELYGDAAILNAPPLEFDHFHVPPLKGILEHKAYVHGFMAWEERFLPGRTSVDAEAATATTSGTAFGYVVTINPSAVPGARQDFLVHEAMAGNMTIRFPTRSNRAYDILDVNESAQTLLIGQTIQDVNDGDNYHFDQLDTADLSQAAIPFILEAKNYHQRWSKRDQISYWPGWNSRNIGKQDGEGITTMWVADDSVVIAKENRLYVNRYDSSPGPGDGRIYRLSPSIGCPSAHGHCSGEGVEYFQHYTGIYQTDGGVPRPVARVLGFGRFTPGLFSVHDRQRRAIIHFATQVVSGPGSVAAATAFVHFYEENKWSMWGWAGRTFTAGLATVDSDTIERVYLSTSDGFHYCQHDSFDGVGTADGHASAADTLFFARSRATAEAAVGTLIDTTNRFPNHTTTGASVIGDSIRIKSGKGVGQTGVIATRVSDTQVTITWDQASPVALDETSEYEIGYLEWFYRLPWLRHGLQNHRLDEAHVFYLPKEWTALGERFRHDKRLELKVVQGFPATGVATMAFKEFQRPDPKTVDRETKIPLLDIDTVDNAALIDYTNGTFETTTPITRARAVPNPGHAHAKLPAAGMYLQLQIGETGTRIKGEVTSLALVIGGMEGKSPAA